MYYEIYNMSFVLQMTAQYPTAVLQTITNPDGTVSIIQMDPSNPIITLPDGTTAQVQGVATVSLRIIQDFTILNLSNITISCFPREISPYIRI